MRTTIARAVLHKREDRNNEYRELLVYKFLDRSIFAIWHVIGFADNPDVMRRSETYGDTNRERTVRVFHDEVARLKQEGFTLVEVHPELPQAAG